MSHDLDAGIVAPARTLGAAIVSPGTRRWYLGGLVALTWLGDAGTSLYTGASTTERVLGTALLLVFAAAFLLIPPVNQRVPKHLKLLLPLGLLALSFAFVPFLGWGVATLWTYVGVAAAVSMTRIAVLVPFVLALAGLTVLFDSLDGITGEALFALPLILVSVSLMMAAFMRQIRGKQELRATQEELSRLAVQQERNRVARDLHDILGHSLTVITVKAELVGRLIDTDPARASREIGDLEDLARGALADVRSTVAGYRGVSVASELANARSALESAGIRPTLPGSADDVPAGLRELFGWVVREGVTNVVRHSGAENATVRLGPRFVEVDDDGRGPATSAGNGTGLAGLRERVDAAGASMTVGRSDAGGFRLRVAVADEVRG